MFNSLFWNLFLMIMVINHKHIYLLHKSSNFWMFFLQKKWFKTSIITCTIEIEIKICFQYCKLQIVFINPIISLNIVCWISWQLSKSPISIYPFEENVPWFHKHLNFLFHCYLSQLNIFYDIAFKIMLYFPITSFVLLNFPINHVFQM